VFQNFCGLHQIVSGEHLHLMLSDVRVYIYAFTPYVSFENRIESNCRFLLKNRSKSTVHLKARIVTH